MRFPKAKVSNPVLLVRMCLAWSPHAVFHLQQSCPMAIKVYFMISLLPNKKVSRGNPSKFDQRQLRRLQFVMADLRLWSPE
jgi:hypothetical protein